MSHNDDLLTFTKCDVLTVRRGMEIGRCTISNF